MFKIEYEEYGVRRQPIITQDCKDVVQILINIANDEKVEKEAYDWCCNAHWGDNFVNQKYKFSIKCIYDEKHVLKPGTEGSKLNRSSNPFMDEVKLQKIADVISKRTGYANEFIGIDNDSLTWDFAYGVSYMKNNNGKGLYFALNDDIGKELTDILDTDAHRFVDRVVNAFKVYIKSEKMKSINNKEKKSMRNDDIVKAMIDAEAYKKEAHFRIYDDGCWWVDIERHIYGQIRIWVGFEDKRNRECRTSLVSLAWLNATELRYCTDGIQIKQAVWDKIQSTAKALIKHGILKL